MFSSRFCLQHKTLKHHEKNLYIFDGADCRYWNIGRKRKGNAGRSSASQHIVLRLKQTDKKRRGAMLPAFILYYGMLFTGAPLSCR